MHTPLCLSSLKSTYMQAVSTNTQLFERLETTWAFTPGPAPGEVSGLNQHPQTTWVAFKIEFSFRSALYAQTSQLFLDEVASAMLGAFEKRCRTVADATVKYDNHQNRMIPPTSSHNTALSQSCNSSATPSATIPAKVLTPVLHEKSISSFALRQGQSLQQNNGQVESRQAVIRPVALGHSRTAQTLTASTPTSAGGGLGAKSRLIRRMRITPFPAPPSDSLW